MELLGRIFLTVLGMSVGGTLLLLFIWAVRKVAGLRLSRQLFYYAWILVLLRLAVPFSPEISLLSSLEGIIAGGGLPMNIERTFDENGSQEEAPGQNTAEGTENVVIPPAAETPGTELGETLSPDEVAVPAGAESVKWILHYAGQAGLLWLCVGSLLFAGKAARYRLFLRTLERESRPVTEGESRMRYEEVCADMGISQAPELRGSPRFSAPLLTGILKPRIFLPEEAQGDLRTILRHELTHYKRRDILYKWAVQIICAIHWFNPAVYLMQRQISRDCELSCDEALCGSMPEKERMLYGSALLAAVSEISSRERFCTSMGSEGKRLKERLAAIKGYRKMSRRERLLSGVLAAAFCAGSVFIGACGFTEISAEPRFAPEEQALTNLAGSVLVDYEGGRLQFTVPEERPEGSEFQVRVEGTTLGAQGGWILRGNFHPFAEWEGKDAQPGVYSADIDFENIEELEMRFSLFTEEGSESSVVLRLSGFASEDELAPVYADWQGAYAEVLNWRTQKEGNIDWHLYDMNRDGIPELICGSDKYYVYRFTDFEEGEKGGSLTYLGDMEKGLLYRNAQGEIIDYYSYGSSPSNNFDTAWYCAPGNALIAGDGAVCFKKRRDAGPDRRHNTEDDAMRFYINDKECAEEAYKDAKSNFLKEEARPVKKQTAYSEETTIAIELALWDGKSESFGEATQALKLAAGWARALMLRDDRERFTMLSDNVNREDIALGVSSPWVTGYSLEQLAENKVRILYNERTSAPGDFFIAEEIVTFSAPVSETSLVTGYEYKNIGDLGAAK